MEKTINDKFLNMYKWEVEPKFRNGKLFYEQYGYLAEYDEIVSRTGENNIKDLMIAKARKGKFRKEKEMYIRKQFAPVSQILESRFGLGFSESTQEIRDNMDEWQAEQAMQVLCYFAKQRIYRRGLVNLYDKCKGDEQLFVNNLLVMTSGVFNRKQIEYNLIAPDLTEPQDLVLFVSPKDIVDFSDRESFSKFVSKAYKKIDLSREETRELEKIIGYDQRNASSYVNSYMEAGEEKMEELEQKYSYLFADDMDKTM